MGAGGALARDGAHHSRHTPPMLNGSDRDTAVSDRAGSWPPKPLAWPLEPLSDGEVALDPMTEEDVPRILAGAGDPATQRWLALPSPYTEAMARQFLADVGDAASAGTMLNFAVRRAGQAPLCGSMGVRFEGRRDEGEIGYWISPDARGEGLASAGIRVLARWAIPEFGLRRVEMLVQPRNRASCRACERAGATFEGVRRRGLDLDDRDVADVAVYSLIADDFVPPSA